MIGVKERMMDKERRSPLLLQPLSGRHDLSSYLDVNRAAIEQRLLEHGALLFRGFGLQSIADFDRCVSALSSRRAGYVYRSTPRTAVADKIFTATEYPATQEIPLHNENSYQREWPLKIALCCLTVATSGGETPLACMRSVTASVGSELVDKFEAHRVSYVRHYHRSVDIPWQIVFQTNDPLEVERFCARHEIEHQWVENDILRTAQVCQGVAYHPITGQRVFFNQAHLFHISSLDAAQARAMCDVFGKDRLPRQSLYGDGQQIPAEELSAVRAAFAKASISFPWQAGDVLLLDNMQFAHGRRPFQGTRKVVVALMDPFTASG